MRPDPRFVGRRKEFWANVRTISQRLGYTIRPRRLPGVKGQAGPVRVPSPEEIKASLESIHLSADHLIDASNAPTEMGEGVLAYFELRAEALNRIVEPLLMDAQQAEQLFEELRARIDFKLPVRMNKQTREKKRPAYFTHIINMLIGEALRGLPCNYDPQELTTVTRNRAPFRTLARRIDGAFPSPVDPLAVWEIKEYYYTTTFGSRVADGVYETLLDGMELEELNAALREAAQVDQQTTRIQHLLMVDAHFTWWVKGRSYLCRLFDMLHMGYVDEVLFGREVVDRLPVIVAGWRDAYQERFS